MSDLNEIKTYFSTFSSFFEKNSAGWTILLSLLLLVIYYIVRRVLTSNLKKKSLSKSEREFLKKRIFRYLNYFTLLILFLVWFSKLQVFFVSLFAVAAAIVIALKELIMCITGGMLVKSSRPFKVGHRIELPNIRGFVLETTWLTTKVLEIGPEEHSQQTTGDIITVPNSLMLSNPIKNESYFNGYSIKAFQFKTKNYKKVKEYEKSLVEKAREISANHLEEAKENISRFCKKEGIAIPSVEPRSKIVFSKDDDSILILIKVPVHNSALADVEQFLNRHFVNLLSEEDSN